MGNDIWRIVPVIDNPGATTRDMRFNGLTELTRNGRAFAMTGVGDAIKSALETHVNKVCPHG
jgi:hypothetical protein